MNPTIKLFKEKFPEWDEPKPGAGEGLGALAGTGMYMQYDADRKHRNEEMAHVESFILSEIQKSTQLGYDVGKEDGIAHGMMMSEKEVYKKAREEVLDERRKQFLNTNIPTLIEEMEKDAEEYGQYHDDDCPLNREGGSDFGDVCECEKIKAIKTHAREWMAKVNEWWVHHATEHRKHCTPEGNKMLTKMMGKKNRTSSTDLQHLISKMKTL